MKEKTYNLRELSREADVTERTVRYYIKEGLLPPPQGSGPFSRYGYEHWLRLQFIKRLKDEYLPLSEIKNLLDSRSTEELDELARQIGLIPAGTAGEIVAKGQDVTTAQASDPLRAFIDGGNGRSRLLREQMASWPTAEYEAVSFKSMPAEQDSFESVPVPYMASFAAGAAPEPLADMAQFDEDAEADEAVPEDEPGPVTEATQSFYAPYSQPKAAPRAFSPQAYGGAAPRPQMPLPGGAPVPPGAANRPVPAPASTPLRAMKMSRFAASASDAAPEMAAESMAPVQPPGQVPPPPRPAPMQSSMAVPIQAFMPAPVVVPAQAESNKEIEVVTGQTWERIEVAPGIELHIEKRIADNHRPALANLLGAARRLFGPKEI